jgi:hypothetical protein
LGANLSKVQRIANGFVSEYAYVGGGKTRQVQAQGDESMSNEFPGVGHRYLVDFKAFRVQLFFSSLTSLTYTNINPDGSLDGSETVTIKVETIGDQLFLVTWQEADKTTVIHIEDYKHYTIITNITNPDLTFDQFHGTFTEIS